jgi:hypothetical protein
MNHPVDSASGEGLTGEPVAWRYRMKMPSGNFGRWHLQDNPTAMRDEDEEWQDLYSSAQLAALRKSHAELVEALRPFANYACSPRGTCACNNCIARDAIAMHQGADHA